MATKLLKVGPYEAESELELSLARAFSNLEPQLQPPFSLKIPTSLEYSCLNEAILFGVLTQPGLAIIHMKHLHGIVSDGYALFVGLVARLVSETYEKLIDSVKSQLIWVVKEIVNVLGVGFDCLLVCLLRRVNGGDYQDQNLWLCFELVSLFLYQWDCLLEEEPLILTSGLYVFLRVLADHCRKSGDVKMEALRKLEVEFCVKLLREQFHLCLKMGRDLVRLLQDLFHVPEIKSVWKDLILFPEKFKTHGFFGLSQLYCIRTPPSFFLLRISPEMEVQLRFMMMQVKLGCQERYQKWFARRFLSGPERETVIVDVVRFICCAHHPINETLQSDILPRWAIIGWLLCCCKKSHIAACTKLALFYDWLFFDEGNDNIMNIEPAILLVLFSIPKYTDITHCLLDFLLILAENYDEGHRNIVLKGLSSALNALVQKQVVTSLDVLTSCNATCPSIRGRLENLLELLNLRAPIQLHPVINHSNTILPTKDSCPSTQQTGQKNLGFLH